MDRARGLWVSTCAVTLAVAGCGEGAPAVAGGEGGSGLVAGGGGAAGAQVFVDPANCGRLEVGRVAYVNDRGSFVGREAIDELSNDCVLGEAPSLASPGCRDEADQVVADSTVVTRAELSLCIRECLRSQSVETEQLAAVCVGCFAEQRACELGFCAEPCETGEGCDQCLCEANCEEDFLMCSDLPAGPACEVNSE